MIAALDLDGTLITCEPRQSACLQAALVCYGIRVSTSQVWELKREGASTEQALVLLKQDPILARRVAEHWRQMIEEPYWLGLDSTLPGTISILGAMRATQAKLCLITARSRPQWIPQQLARLGLRHYLDHITVVPPQTATNAKATVLRESRASVFFGDTESDYEASVSADVPFFAVTTGQRSAGFLVAANVSHVCETLRDAWTSFLRSSENPSKETCSNSQSNLEA